MNSLTFYQEISESLIAHRLFAEEPSLKSVLQGSSSVVREQSQLLRSLIRT